MKEPFGIGGAAAGARKVAPQELQVALAGNTPAVIFVETSREFASGHVPGARWVSRSWLELDIGSIASVKSAPIVVTDRDGRNAVLAGATLREMGYTDVTVLAGGMAAWCQASLPVEQGLSGVMAPPEDIVPAGPERPHHDMINYLRWEEALGHKYRVPSPKSKVPSH